MSGSAASWQAKMLLVLLAVLLLGSMELGLIPEGNHQSVQLGSKPFPGLLEGQYEHARLPQT